MELSISEELMYSTIRIESYDKDDNVSFGTGFIFNFKLEGGNQPVLVTNKHVVNNAKNGRFLFTLSDEKGAPSHDNKYLWKVEDFRDFFLAHPDPNVELCVMPLAPLLKQMNNEGRIPFYRHIPVEYVPTDEEFNDLTAIEEIIMIGYPIGLWDEVNNLPIIRKGITATHPSFNHNNKKEFLIDAACFPGSSGSPVFLFNPSGYPTKKGYLLGPGRVKLLGILYAGPQMSVKGKIEIIEIPTTQKQISVSSFPINLGYVIKSQLLFDFEPLIKERIGRYRKNRQTT